MCRTPDERERERERERAFFFGGETPQNSKVSFTLLKRLFVTLFACVCKVSRGVH